MGTRVEQIAEQVRALLEPEREEFLAWLAEYELANCDPWDQQLADDSAPGGRLTPVLERVRRDISEGMTKLLDQVLDDA